MKQMKSLAPCNCKDKNNCTMSGNCKGGNLVEKSIVSETEKSKKHF